MASGQKGRRRKVAAITLLETLIALFVLLTAFVIVLSLFLKSTDDLVNVERKVMAVAFGETVLDDIKVWCDDYANYSGDWSTWQNMTLPGYNGFSARAFPSQPQVANPCSLLELGKPVATRTLMSDSFRDVTLVIAHDGVTQLSLTTRIAEPARAVQKVLIEPIGGVTLAPQAEATFKATLQDANSDPISDVVFRWAIEPITGNGSVRAQVPDSSLGIVKNAYIGNDGLVRIVPGTVKVRAVARYRGRDYGGVFETVELTP